MKIAFLCGGLEPGKDGVGDYARRLAGEFIRRGNSCQLVALNDTNVSQVRFESQESEGGPIPVLRLPVTTPWASRTPEVREWLGDFQPDWISLQFVPFSFHHRGLNFGLGKFLASLNTQAAWQVMFHELWLGLGENAPMKDRVYGALQRRIALEVIRTLRPRVINTHADRYREVLQREGIKASILPLFSNIPRGDEDGWQGLLEPLVAASTGTPQNRENVYLAGVLGAVHPEWNAEKTVETLLPLVRRFEKRLVLVFHGKNNLSPGAFRRLALTLKGRADVVVAGERSERDISRILNTLDVGLATSPREMIQKSGSAAAMLEHGLQVLVTRDDWHLRGSRLSAEDTCVGLLSPGDFAMLKMLPTRDAEWDSENNVQQIAKQMMRSMNPTLILESVVFS